MTSDATPPSAGSPAEGEGHGMQPRAGSGSNAIEKTLLVLEAIINNTRFTDVVEATGLAKATTHRILSTLVDSRFVTLDSDGSYLPGPKILSLAGRALASIDISAIAQPFVDELVGDVKSTVHVGVVNGDEIVYLIRSDSHKPYQMPSRVGHSIPMHSSGIGKVVLGDRTDEEVKNFVVRAGLHERTKNTITTLEGLLAELAKVREQGYALDNQENELGVACVAAPIHDHTGTIKYGVSISTITLEHTIEQVEAMSATVIATARKISASLGYTP